jgi:undecaprenyl phosphate-alpha-L-ara4FN deformylase
VTRLVLKVDVDTYQGLCHGVPRLLECLAAQRVAASFFVAMGPDHSGRAVRRFFTQRGFTAKMVRSNAFRLYGLRSALYGTLLPGPQIARSAPECLRRIRGEGHELGVHGNDHVYWHDRLSRLPLDAVAGEVERALATFRELVGGEPEGFAAPGWQLSAAAITVLDRGPFVYQSSTRGSAPYRPRIGGVLGRIPEIPTTLPTLDERLGLGEDAVKAVDDLAARLRPDALEVLTVHAEVEGGACLGAFVRLLERLRERVRFQHLGDIARALDPAKLPVCEVVAGELPGRAGSVSCQEQARAGNGLRATQ